MRSRAVVLSLFLVFTVVPVRYAWAGAGWGVAFMEWLEHINPGPYGGISGEVNFCTALVKDANGKRQGCDPAKVFSADQVQNRPTAPRARLLYSVQGGITGEYTKSEQPLEQRTILFPVTGVVQYVRGKYGIGGGGGALIVSRVRVGGTDKETVKEPFGVVRLSYTPHPGDKWQRLSLQLDFYLLPGFDAGAFGNPEKIEPEKQIAFSTVVRF